MFGHIIYIWAIAVPFFVARKRPTLTQMAVFWVPKVAAGADFLIYNADIFSVIFIQSCITCKKLKRKIEFFLGLFINWVLKIKFRSNICR